MNFLTIAKGGKFAVKCASNGSFSKFLLHFIYEIMKFFRQKNRKIITLKKLENMMKKECFSKKISFSCFKKLFSQKWEGEKYTDGSRPIANQLTHIMCYFDQLDAIVFITTVLYL